ncbi:hypothetical protein MJ579_05450 [Klebsiella pneumoniae]|nr:hypothetical protein MJ579_05450 [Klebsiella pneumoniae]
MSDAGYASLDSRVDGIVVAINASRKAGSLQDFAGTSLQLSCYSAGGGRPVAGERRAGCR